MPRKKTISAEINAGRETVASPAGFPELNPSPVIELDSSGDVKYLNPAAMRLFPDLESLGIRHPFLSGAEKILPEIKDGEPGIVSREIVIGNLFYNQIFTKIPKVESYRIYCSDITGLRMAEKRFKQALDHMLEGCMILGFDWKYIYLNDVSAEHGQNKKENLLGRTILEMYPGVEKSSVFANYRYCMEKRVPKRFTESFTFAGGVTRWYEFSASPVPEGIFVLSIDITGQKKEEANIARVNRALRLSSETNKALIHARSESELLKKICEIAVENGNYRMAWVGFAENDEEKTIRPVAYAGFESGYLKAAKITWADTERGRGPSGIAIRTGKSSVARDIAIDAFMTPWRADAAERGYRSSIALPLMNDGRAFGMIGIYSGSADVFSPEEVRILDELADDLAFGVISLRSMAEREIFHAEREQYFKFFNLSNDIMVIADPNGNFKKVNPTCLSILGYLDSELIAKPFIDFVHPDDRQSTLDEMAKQVRTGSSINFENRYICKDGSVIWLSWRAIYEKDEGITYATARDITARKRGEARLKELDALKSRFIQIVSHQLRTPLNLIRWNLENLLEGDLGILTEGQSQLIKISYHADLDVISKIRDIVTAMDIEEGHSAYLSKSPCSLDALWNSVNVECRKKCGIKNMACKYIEPENPLPSTDVDMDKIRFVMEKFSDNAITYTREKGEMTVSLKQIKNRIRFEISDNGIGIPKEEQPNIFSRFFRASNASVMNPDASGLGLFIAKYFINQHGGTIGFNSEEGKGSMFWFEIPIKAEA